MQGHVYGVEELEILRVADDTSSCDRVADSEASRE
jgi:hypothetical protein